MPEPVVLIDDVEKMLESTASRLEARCSNQRRSGLKEDAAESLQLAFALRTVLSNSESVRMLTVELCSAMLTRRGS
jgi:hypothetical protein